MDIQKIISDLLEKFNVDASLLEKFKKDPLETVKGLLATLNLNLDMDQINAVVEGLKTKLNIEDIVKEGGGLLEKIKSFFGGK